MSTSTSSSLPSVEEANLPEKLSETLLRKWNSSRSRNVRFVDSKYNGQSIFAEVGAFLLSQQHLLALDPAIKRTRRRAQRFPDLIPAVKENLPAYLQDIVRHNPELMTHVTTEVHVSLPNLAAIKEERELDKLKEVKAWKHGVAPYDYLGLLCNQKKRAAIENH